MSEITIVTEDGQVITRPTEEELRALWVEQWTQWMHKVVNLCGAKTIEEATILANDPSFFFCFDDGLTPEEAVKEYQVHLESINA